MFGFLKGHIEYLAQHLQPAKCIPKEQNVDMKPTPEKYGPTGVSRLENKEFMIKVPQAMSQLCAYEKLRQVSSNNEVIAKTSSAFLKI